MRYLEHVTSEGERWDNLAWRFYGDALAYERIIVVTHTSRSFPFYRRVCG